MFKTTLGSLSVKVLFGCCQAIKELLQLFLENLHFSSWCLFYKMCSLTASVAKQKNKCIFRKLLQTRFYANYLFEKNFILLLANVAHSLFFFIQFLLKCNFIEIWFYGPWTSSKTICKHIFQYSVHVRSVFINNIFRFSHMIFFKDCKSWQVLFHEHSFFLNKSKSIRRN